MLKRKVRSFMLGGLAMLFFTVLTLSSFAQQLTVKGRILAAEDNSPLPGVSVVIKGTTKGTISDFDGNYTLKANKGEVLLFQFIGMQPQEHKVTSTTLNVSLKSSVIDIEEVVAVGYGTVKKKELTGAVARVKAEEVAKISTPDIATALQGKIAGVNVQASSGAPGETANIQIRGVASSFQGADNNPLYVVDGVPFDGDPGLSPEEIQSIDVLKDAASTAAYGTRGAKGVIIVTTKKGKAGQLKASYHGYYGVQKINSGLPLVSFEDHMYIDQLYNVNNIKNSYENDFWHTVQQSPHLMTNNNNIMDLVTVDAAPTQNHTFQVSGGKKDLTASAVLNYFSQDGTLVNSKYERTNGRLNVNFKKEKFSLAGGVAFSLDEKTNAPWGILYDAYKFKPYSNMIDPSAMSFVSEGSENDANNASQLAIKFAQSDVTEGTSLNGNVRANYELAKGLKFTYTFGANYRNTFRKYVVPKFELYDFDGKPKAQQTRSQVLNTSGYSSKITSEVGVNYTKKVKKHRFKLLGVYSYEKSDYNQHTGVKYDLASNDVTTPNGGTADPNFYSGSNQWDMDRTTVLIGMLGRLNYDYNGRYLFTASLRRDGSSRFGPENRFEYFPGFSAGWNISDEAFFKSLKSTISTLKFRGSYGKVGNDGIGDYNYSSGIAINRDYAFGLEGKETLESGAAQIAYANPSVKWETSVSTNLGVDMYLFNNKVQFTGEYYLTEKEDMLFPLQLPASAGVGNGNDATSKVPYNVGNMTNEGVELAATYKHKGKFSWSLGGVFMKNVNRITSLPDGVDIFYYSDGKPVSDGGNNYTVTALAKGYEAGSFFMRPTDGLVTTEEELAEYKLLAPGARLGDLKYVDSDGNGELNDKDRVYCGSGMPEWEASMNFDAQYKGFDFSMQWYGSYGNEIINGSKLYASFNGNHQDMVHQWSPQNPTSTIAINRGRDHDNFASHADIWVEDGSYIRLRNVILGYSVPKRLISKINLSKLRFYVAAQNPLTFTKYDGYDPEVGGNGLSKRGLDIGNYPVAAIYRGGVQLNF